MPQLRMPAANDEKKPPPEEAAPPPWSLDPIAGDLPGVKRAAAAQQRESRARGRERLRVWVWGGDRSGYLRIGQGRGAVRAAAATATSPRGIRTRGGIWNGRGRTRAQGQAGRRAGVWSGRTEPPRTPPGPGTGSGGVDWWY